MVSISPYTKGSVETLLYRDPMIRRLLENEISHLVEQFHRTVTNGNFADGVRTLTFNKAWPILVPDLCRNIKYLKFSSYDPLDELSLLVSSVDRLCETKIEFLQLNDISDGDMESIKLLFSAIPSLKIVDFRRPNYDADGFWFRFRRHKLHAEPEWIEG
ncbi:hypothetical protein PTI98_011042 [Pleurotus ostreatus]|nr:hypothetical protein PTI98_011042 [Pleurotus ostreatus]